MDAVLGAELLRGLEVAGRREQNVGAEDRLADEGRETLRPDPLDSLAERVQVPVLDAVHAGRERALRLVHPRLVAQVRRQAAGPVVALYQDAPVVGKTGKDRKRCFAVKHISRIEVRHIFVRF